MRIRSESAVSGMSSTPATVTWTSSRLPSESWVALARPMPARERVKSS